MQKGYARLRPLDAVHLASAAVANADEMHTFDGALLALDGKVTKANGTLLKICKPSLGGPPLPLLDSGDSTDGADVTDEHEAEESDEGAGRAQPLEGDPSIPGSGEGVGLPEGPSDIRPIPEAGRDGGAAAEVRAEEVAAEIKTNANEEFGLAIEQPIAGIQEKIETGEAKDPLSGLAASKADPKKAD